MLKSRLIALAAVSALATACIPSFHPIWSEETLVTEPDIAGTWQETEDDDTWTFAPIAGKAHALTIRDGGDVTELEARLVRLDDLLVMDLFPSGGGDDAFEGVHHVRAHTFWRVRVSGDEMKLQFVDGQWLSKELERNPGSLAHVKRGGEILLTATTAELQAFVGKHADRIFDDDVGELRRVAAQAAAPASAVEGQPEAQPE